MHILLVCRSFPHHRAGGMEWHAQDIAEGLMAAGHTVSVWTTPLPRRPALSPLEVNGRIVTTGRCPAQYDLAFFLSAAMGSRRRLLSIKPDLVHAQGYAGIAAQWVFGGRSPVLTTVHGTLWSETPLRRGNSLARLDRLGKLWHYKHRLFFTPFWRSLVRRGHLIVDSRFTARELRGEVGGVPRPAVVPLGINLDRFPMGNRDAVRKEWNLEADDPLLLTIGRMERIKRPEWAVEAFIRLAGRVPRARLIVAGEGPELPALRRRAAQSPAADRIHFPGRIETPDLPGLYEAADLFLNADHGAPAFGLANAEALLMGAGVLATDTGAHGEVVPRGDEGCGLVTPGDFMGWCGEMEGLLARLPEADRSREKRWEEARKRFSRERMMRRLEGVYSRTCEGN